MPRGGARANSGGARVGAGRKPHETARTVAVKLSEDEAAMLARLEARLERTASDVLRRALVELAERQPA